MVRNGGNLAVIARLSTYVTNKSKVPNPQTANDRVFLPQSTVSLSPTRDSHTYFITCTLRACSHAPSQRLTVYYICDVHSASALATKCVGTKRVFPSVRVPLQPSHNPRYGHNTLAPFRSGPTEGFVAFPAASIAARRPSCIAWFLHLGFLPAVRHWSILHVVPGLTTVYASGSRLGPNRASYGA